MTPLPQPRGLPRLQMLTKLGIRMSMIADEALLSIARVREILDGSVASDEEHDALIRAAAGVLDDWVYSIAIENVEPPAPKVRGLDLTGIRYGRLVAREKVGKLWRCDCDCGGTADVTADRLRREITKSCGCIRKGVVLADGYNADRRYDRAA